MRKRRAVRVGLFTLSAWLLTVPSLALSHTTSGLAATTPAAKPKPVLAWGTNFLGEAGDGGSGDQYGCCGGHPYGYAYNDYPVQTAGLTGAIAVSAGWESSAAIVQGHAPDGTPDPAQNTLWTWGEDMNGQLGAQPPDVCLTPETNTPNGQIVVIGYARSPCAKQPVEVRGPGGIGYFTGVVAIADGGRHILALRDDGTVWAWGDDSLGELGTDPPSSPNPACPTSSNQYETTSDAFCVPYPVRVPGLTGVTAIADSLLSSVAIVHRGGPAPDDTVWAWGDNTAGELGRGWDCYNAPRCWSAAPERVPGISSVTTIAAGSEDGPIMVIVRGHAADGSDNQLWTWGGANQFGESGVNVNGPVFDASHRFLIPIDSPTRVLDASGTSYFSGAVAVSTGAGSTVALKYDPALHTTTVWNWGDWTPAASGTPGGPSQGSYVWTTPRQVRGANGSGFLTGGVAVATNQGAPGGSAYALLADGTVWGWGFDDFGDLAWPPSTIRPDGGPYSTFPIEARGVAGATAFAVGYDHVLTVADPPPTPPPVVKQPDSAPPPPPFEQLSPTSAVLQPQVPASVPVVNPGVVPSAVGPPQPPAPGGVASSHPILTPVQGSQLVAGTPPVPGSAGALAPSAGDRPNATDQLAMLRHDDSADVAGTIGIAAAAAAALIVCLGAVARSRRPPAVRPAPAWAGQRGTSRTHDQVQCWSASSRQRTSP